MSLLEQLPWIALQSGVNLLTYARRSPWLTSTNQPNELKTYTGKEYLFASRIYRPAETTGPLPLIIRIHGGGFMMNSPAGDDELCRLLADRVGCVVMSIDHRKIPRNPFPAAYEDVVDLILDATGDRTLGINPSKVIVFGSSSGGNLALGTAQDPRLRGKLLGVLALTPIVDLAVPLQEKIHSRPDPTVPDFLVSLYDKIIRFYLGGKDIPLSDVRLSPARFKRREGLPKYIYLISAEHDLLAKETRMMAERLAGESERHGSDDDWDAGAVKWSLIRGQKHGFEKFAEKDRGAEAARLIAVDQLEQKLVSWLIDTLGAPQ